MDFQRIIKKIEINLKENLNKHKDFNKVLSDLNSDLEKFIFYIDNPKEYIPNNIKNEKSLEHPINKYYNKKRKKELILEISETKESYKKFQKNIIDELNNDKKIKVKKSQSIEKDNDIKINLKKK